MNLPVEAQVSALKEVFADRPDGLRRHVERVEVEALALAAYWHVDPARASLATWGHDLFRSMAGPEQLLLAKESGVHIGPAEEAEPVLLHGPTAAVVLRERFGVTDDDALAAVRDHTLGAPEMPLLAKIILIADKVEVRKRKRTPVMAEVRRLARRDLDLALLCWADWKWVQERANGWNSHPGHWAARQRWVLEHHDEAGLPARTPEDLMELDGTPA